MSRRHIGIAATLMAGVGAGLLLALPVPDIAGHCPPAHEGLVKCVVDRQVLPSIAKLLIGIAGVYAAVEVAFAMPGIYRRWRAGTLFGRTVGEDPPWEADPVLVASVWGETYEDADAAAGGIQATRLARKLRERRRERGLPDQPVPEAPAPADLPAEPPSPRVAAAALLLQELESLTPRR